MYFFQFNMSGSTTTQYVKADNLYEAYDKAVVVAGGKENFSGLLQVIGSKLRDLQLTNFDGCLHE